MAENVAGKSSLHPALLAVGSVIGAIAASSCCVVPLLLFLAGVGGAWMSNLTALAPYQSVFLALTFIALFFGFRAVYRPTCSDGQCAWPMPHPVVKVALWSAVALAVAAVAFPYAAPLLLGS